MENDHVLIIGSGHLASRVDSFVNKHGFKITHVTNDAFTTRGQGYSVFDTIKRALEAIDLSSLLMVYVIDDLDEHNLEIVIALLSLKKDLRITASFYNENISPHLRAAHPNIQILNPAKMAAATFVEALYTPIKHSLRYAPSKLARDPKVSNFDALILSLLGSFIILILATTAYFHFYEHLSWLNSLYFVVVTVATVGYGDINLLNSSATSKIVGIGLILISTFFIWMIFSLTIDRIIKKRVQFSLGIKKYSHRNHVILCGLGRLGYFVAEALLERGEKLIIIEKNQNSTAIEYFRGRGAIIYIGDARLPRILQDVATANAKALFSLINDDFTNLEIGLNARSLEPNLRLILRIFDESMSEMIKDNLDIHLTYSMSSIVDDEFFDILNK